jgi:vacuolar-type H+-ATPase subunit E/Vma4
MGLEKIRQTVLTDAQNKGAHIVNTARMQNAALLSSEKDKVSSEFERIYRAKEAAIEDEYNRLLIAFKGNAGKQILEHRNAILRGLFEKARREILAWPEDRYAGVMRGRIEKTAGNAGGRLRTHPDEKDIFVRIIAEINKGKDKPQITIDEADALQERGGFIFIGPDFEIDQTLSTILAQIEHELLPGIAAELFPG